MAPRLIQPLTITPYRVIWVEEYASNPNLIQMATTSDNVIFYISYEQIL